MISRAPRPVRPFVRCVALLAMRAMGSDALAQPKKKNPASKVYISDVSGDAVINTGEVTADLTKRSVYTAEGTIIETRKPDSDAERDKVYSTMVYSNGTGAYFDADTRVEVRKFVQEPFTPHRTDMEVEPSISQTQAYLARGTVGLCTSKMVAGSSMNYQTPHGGVNIRGRKVVIQSSGNTSTISMLEGESTVRAGAQDIGGHTLKAGEQAIIKAGAAGQPNQIIIRQIPPAEAQVLDEKVSLACQAKRTVYFEARELPREQALGDAASTSSTEDAAASGDASADSSTSGAVTAFYGDSAASSTSQTGATREIVPVPVVPVTLPVEHTVSNAFLTTARPPGN